MPTPLAAGRWEGDLEGRDSEESKCIFLTENSSSCWYRTTKVSWSWFIHYSCWTTDCSLVFWHPDGNSNDLKRYRAACFDFLISSMGCNYYPVEGPTRHNLRAYILRLPLCFAMRKAPAFIHWILMHTIRILNCKMPRFPTVLAKLTEWNSQSSPWSTRGKCMFSFWLHGIYI